MRGVLLLGMGLVTWIPSIAFAGSSTSGGGTAMICPDATGAIGTVQMLDIYEGEITYGYQIPAYADKSAEEIIDIALSNLSDLPLRDDLRRLLLKAISDTVFLPPGVVMNTPGDVGDGGVVVVQAGCSLGGVGYYAVPANQPAGSDPVLTVSVPYYQKLDSRGLAALFLHEAIYKFARDSVGATDAVVSRRLTAALLAGSVGDSDIENFFNRESSTLAGSFVEAVQEISPAVGFLLNDQETSDGNLYVSMGSWNNTADGAQELFVYCDRDEVTKLHSGESKVIPLGDGCFDVSLAYYTELFPDQPHFSIRTVDREIMNESNFIPGNTTAEAFIHYEPQPFHLPVPGAGAVPAARTH